MRFKDRVAVVAGGASGIGKAAAVLMAAEGATVVALDVMEDALREVGAEIDALGGKVIVRRADVLIPSEVEDAVQATVEQIGRVDILVNVVGGSTVLPDPNVPLDRITPSLWSRTIDFNLQGTFLCCHAVIPHMKRRKYGRIVNLSSIVGRGDTRFSNVAYATAKAGIRAFTRKLAIELGPYGITCNATAPGVTLTERIIKLRTSRQAGDPQTRLDDIPLGRISTVDDQAKVIAFLASDDAAFISGQTIEVTGGQ